MTYTAYAEVGKVVELMIRSISFKNDHRYQEALACLDEAVTLNPIFFPALFDKGTLLNSLSRYEEASECFERVLNFTPGDANTLELLNKSLEDALQQYELHLSLNPGDAEAFYKRANLLRQLHRYEEAIGSYDRALELKPVYPDALNERGNALILLNRYEDAIACYDRLLEQSENHAIALFNRGNALRGIDRIAEALASYRAAAAVAPEMAEAFIEQSHCHLLMGEYGQGWPQYEYRWLTEQLRIYLPLSPQPLWLGKEQLADKTILLLCEQGFGDTIQFLRFIPLVAEQAKQTILRIPAPLAALIEDTLTGIRIIGTEEPFPPHDVHCPLMSLPLALGTELETVPNDVPYISAPPAQTEKWRARLGPGNRPRVGIAWAGRQYPPLNHRRDMRLAAIAPLMNLNIELISLQKDVPAHDSETIAAMPCLNRLIESSSDFADTAALIANLDLVICVDTVIAHLAGALGKPVWIMVSYINDWRWLHKRSDSPWYPAARIFRQKTHDDWDEVVREIVQHLEDSIISA